ncbi:MAG: hypothetical protein WCK10_00900 [Candidatus Staskawiczbacteria bacterium]
MSERVIKFLAEKAGISPEGITPESLLLSPPMNIDWADISIRVAIGLYLEDNFGLTFISSDVDENWKTVADIIAYIESVPHS